MVVKRNPPASGPAFCAELLSVQRVPNEPGGLVPRNDRSYRKCAGEDAPGADGCSGRRTFDKTVSSGPLAFAAGAAAMGFQCRFGTSVLLLSGDSVVAVVNCEGTELIVYRIRSSKQGRSIMDAGRPAGTR